MRYLGLKSAKVGRVYFTGGVTAVLHGWRASTVDLDLTVIPESDQLLRALSDSKEEFKVNVELASPAHFIPELPGWEGRCVYIGKEGKLSFYHYDFYSQALSKIERGHDQDRTDVRMMFTKGLVESKTLRALFGKIEPNLHKYPAIDPNSFAQRLEQTLQENT